MLPDFQSLTLSSSSSWKCNQPRSDLTPRVRKFTWQKMLNVRDLPLENNLVGQSLMTNYSFIQFVSQEPPVGTNHLVFLQNKSKFYSLPKTCNISLGVIKSTTFHSMHWVTFTISMVNAKLIRSWLIVRKRWICCLKWIEFKWLVWDLHVLTWILFPA